MYLDNKRRIKRVGSQKNPIFPIVPPLKLKKTES